jgi:hypothetical protein
MQPAVERAQDDLRPLTEGLCHESAPVAVVALRPRGVAGEAAIGQEVGQGDLLHAGHRGVQGPGGPQALPDRALRAVPRSAPARDERVECPRPAQGSASTSRRRPSGVR